MEDIEEIRAAKRTERELLAQQLQQQHLRGLDTAQVLGGWTAREAFDRIDTDGSGSISHVELQQLSDKMRAMGRDPSALVSIVRQLDGDGSGEIEYEEWDRLWRSLSSFCSHDFC